MINYLIFIFLAFLIYPQTQADENSRIITIASVTEINPYLDPLALICFDIDDTLLSQVCWFGTDQWFRSRLQSLTNSYPSDKALEISVFEWETAKYLLNPLPTEPLIVPYPTHLQKKGYSVIAVTASGLSIAERTQDLLTAAKIDFRNNRLSKKNFFLPRPGNEHDLHMSLLFQNGILFLNGYPKGNGLVLLLNKLNYRPRKILFIDDNLTNLMSLDKELQNVDFQGFYYQPRISCRYDEHLADLQRAQKTEIISDETVLSLLLNTSDKIQ